MHHDVFLITEIFCSILVYFISHTRNSNIVLIKNQISSSIQLWSIANIFPFDIKYVATDATRGHHLCIFEL